MVDVAYKNNILVKSDDTAVNLEEDIYRRIEGSVRYIPYAKIGCEQTYKAIIRYVVVGASDITDQLNEIFRDHSSLLISSDTNKERILKEEKLTALLPTNLDRIFKITYETEKIVSKDECARLTCYC